MDFGLLAKDAIDAEAPRRTLAWLRNQDPPRPWSPEYCVLSSKSGLLAVVKQPFRGSSRVWTREHCQQAAKQSDDEVLAELAKADWESVRSAASSKLLQELNYGPEYPASLQTLLSHKPDLSAMNAARGQLDVLKWLMHQPSQQQHASSHFLKALQTAAHCNQLQVVQHLLQDCRLRPTSVKQSVESWYVFTSLVSSTHETCSS